LDKAPLHVVEVVAKALRNHKWFEASAILYAEGMHRWPEHLPFALGRLMALADAGEVEASRSLLRQLCDRHPERRDVLSASVYAAERVGDHLTALDLHQRLLELDPADPGALRGRIRALRLLGASHQALHYAEKTPGLLQEAELLRLHNDAAAHQVRWGSYAPETEKTRYLETDQALKRISANLRRLYAADDAPSILVRQGRIDRMVALRNRVRMPEVVTLYQSLQYEDEDLPAYALNAAADAYLYLEQPEAAYEIYQQVLRLKPDDFDTRLALFYADVELEEFDRAMTRIDRLFAEAQAEKNSDRQRLTAELTAALARVFAGDLPEAQNRIEALHGHAPLNPDLKRELGGVYAARGWPRKAESTLASGLLNNPDHRGLQIARAHNHFDLRQYGAAQAAAEDLYGRFPEDKHVQRLARRSYLHNLREVQIEAGYSDSSESDYGGNELRLGSTLYSSPLREHYRLFAGILWSRGDFAEGRGLYRRYRSGVEYRGRRLEGSAEVNYTAAGTDGVGVAVAGLLHQDDQRAWSFAAEMRSSATPIRALRNGIDADAVRFGFIHRAHERRRWSLGAGLMDFSDGNLRTHLRADLRQRLVTRPHYHLDAVVDLYASLNKKSDVPYYSPQQDASASVTLDNTWLLWRRYQRAFRHRLALTLGAYQQQSYGTGPLFGARYEHMWQADGRFDLVYGIGWHRRIYDGDPENGVDGNLAVRWRF
jgi:biofilm PGA synthesis protein PgaA